MPRLEIVLPRFTVAKPRKRGSAYYFQVPARLRPAGWEAAIRLSDDVATMLAQAERLNKQLDATRADVAERHGPESLPQIVKSYQHSTKFKSLRPKTQYDYTDYADRLLEWSKASGHPSVKLITRPLCLQFLARYDDRPTYRNRIYAFMRLMFRHAMDLGIITVNPAEKLGLEGVDPFVHIWAPEEVDAIVKACDDTGRRSIGTAVLLTHEIGQRQGDVLRLVKGRDFRDGKFWFRQSKTKTWVSIRPTTVLAERLAGMSDGAIVVSEETGRPYQSGNFAHRFRKIADEAKIGDEQKLTHLVFLHLRHTCVVNLARASCTHAEIAAITGHTLESVAKIIKRYLPRDEEVADNAIDKLEQYRAKRAAKKRAAAGGGDAASADPAEQKLDE